MANLVKIKDVRLSTTTRVDANTTNACVYAREFLTLNGIKFSEVWYNDEKVDERTPVLKALSTWSWGPNGSKGKREFTAFPILHWTECYDDWSTHVEHAAGPAEIKDCTLIANKGLIE